MPSSSKQIRTRLELRAACMDDLPRLVELLALLFSQEADFRPDTRKQRRALRLLLNSPGAGTIFIARRANEVVGMVSLLYTISTAEGGAAAWLEDMVVHPAHRGSRIGSRLLNHVIAFARARRLTRITLLTDRSNRRAARFYQSHGFSRSSMVPLRLKLGR